MHHKHPINKALLQYIKWYSTLYCIIANVNTISFVFWLQMYNKYKNTNPCSSIYILEGLCFTDERTIKPRAPPFPTIILFNGNQTCESYTHFNISNIWKTCSQLMSKLPNHSKVISSWKAPFSNVEPEYKYGVLWGNGLISALQIGCRSPYVHILRLSHNMFTLRN